MANLGKHDHATLKFPNQFLWGAATSALQVEGGNTHSDWWEWEATHQPESHRSGAAADQYHLYKQDFDLAKELGHNAHRLSIEWSRIEPKEGEFDTGEIEHYLQVLKHLKSLNLTVMLTLHHFSNPAWFAKKGGWSSIWAPGYFTRFVRRIVPELKDYVDLWVTINEPMIYASHAFYLKVFPPQTKSLWQMAKALLMMAWAHRRAYKIIHQLIPSAQVGIANSVQSFDTIHSHSLRENIARSLLNFGANRAIYLLTGRSVHDFLAINYYQNFYINLAERARIPSLVDIARVKTEVSDLGWELHPEGIFDMIMDFSDWRRPIYIAESGIPSKNDDRRVRFLLSYLTEVYHAIQLGADVRGYFYWSLIDNMELNKGFEPKFGLIEVDFTTQVRSVRPSAHVYEEIIRHNGIPHYLLKLLGHGTRVEDVLKDPHDLRI